MVQSAMRSPSDHVHKESASAAQPKSMELELPPELAIEFRPGKFVVSNTIAKVALSIGDFPDAKFVASVEQDGDWPRSAMDYTIRTLKGERYLPAFVVAKSLSEYQTVIADCICRGTDLFPGTEERTLAGVLNMLVKGNIILPAEFPLHYDDTALTAILAHEELHHQIAGGLTTSEVKTLDKLIPAIAKLWPVGKRTEVKEYLYSVFDNSEELLVFALGKEFIHPPGSLWAKSRPRQDSGDFELDLPKLAARVLENAISKWEEGGKSAQEIKRTLLALIERTRCLSNQAFEEAKLDLIEIRRIPSRLLEGLKD